MISLFNHVRSFALTGVLISMFFALVTGGAVAQSEVPPTITLGAPPAPEVPPVLEPGSGPSQQPPSTPTPGTSLSGAAESPFIRLQLPEVIAPTPSLTPLAIERDRTVTTQLQPREWLFPLVADPRLPRRVQIGETVPEPGILRLTGETASSQMRLVLPESNELPANLQLALRSGVDVLVGAAFLDLSINGGDVLELPLKSIGDFTQTIVPATGLRPGINTIDLSVRQPHRIFCGPDASFDVWTEINLMQSGATLAASSVRPDTAGFQLALEAQLAHNGSLDLLVEEDIDPAVLRRASDMVMTGLGQQGRLRVGSFYGDTEPRFAAVALIASDRSAVSFRAGSTGAIILQVEYNADTLPDIGAALPEIGSSAVSAPPVTPGIPSTLSELGHGDIIGNTHYFRKNIDFSLPDDWLLLANQKARLTLHYGFARQLAVGAILLVKVNDQTVRLLPLDREGGQIQPLLPVGFNANLLHPGRNTLSFEMMVPGDPPDEACPARTTDMLVVLSKSVLEVPTSPSMILPGMASTVLALMPENVTTPLAAAADPVLQATAIRLASAMTEPTVPRETVTLTVARLSELGLLPLDVAGVSQGQLQSLLFPQRVATVGSEVAFAQATPTYTLEMPTEADDDPVAPGVLSRAWTEISGRLFSQARLLRDVREFRQTAFQGSELSLRDWLSERSGAAMLWRPDPQAPDSLWLILAPQVSVDEVAERLQELIAARQAIGEAAVLQTDGSWQIWTPIRPPELREWLFGSNLRAILGNYASWSPLLFTLSLLALALLSAVPALFYVLASRESKGR